MESQHLYFGVGPGCSPSGFLHVSLELRGYIPDCPYACVSINDGPRVDHYFCGSPYSRVSADLPTQLTDCTRLFAYIFCRELITAPRRGEAIPNPSGVSCTIVCRLSTMLLTKHRKSRFFPPLSTPSRPMLHRHGGVCWIWRLEK